MIAIKFPLRRAALLWTGYVLLALVLTWPTVSHLNTHLPGDGGDDPAIAWNLWWIKYALLNAGQNPFQSDFMFFPIGINLAFYTLTVLNAVSALPLTLNLGVVTASNLHMLFTFVTGAYGTYLLTLYILTTDHRPPTDVRNPVFGGRRSTVSGLVWFSAAIAGGFYAFAGSKLFYVTLGQFNIASTHWIPFAVLYIIKTHRQPRRLKNPTMAGLFITFQAWTEMTYASFILVFLGLYWLYWILDFRYFGFAQHKFWILDYKSIWRAVLPHLRTAGVLLATFFIGLVPILAQMLPDMRAEGDFLVEGGGFAGAFSADLLGFIIPTMHHPLFGNLITQTHIAAPNSVTGFSKGQHIYLGFALLGLLVVTLFTGYRYRPIRFWLIAAGLFLLLSLGPTIAVNGYSTGIPGPFTLLQSLPFFKGNRYPSRYSVMLMLCLSVIAAFGLIQVGRWVIRLDTRRRWWPGYLSLTMIAAFFLFEHLSLPLPQSNMQIPAAYQTIAADPDEFTVLDIPFAWRNGFRITGALTTQFMFGQFYQTAHQKQLLQGNTSRNPEFKFQYFTNAPVINSLLALETGKTISSEQWAADKAIAADVLNFFDIKYIVVRPESNNPFGHYPQTTLPYIEAVFPVEKIHNDSKITIYQVQSSNQDTDSNTELLINSDAPLAPLYFGEGWGLVSQGHPITAQREETRLLLPLNGDSQRITLRLRLPDFAETDTRSISVALNGWQSNPQQITKTWQEISFELPQEAVLTRLNDLRLHFDGVTQRFPHQPGAPATDITVLSAGEEVGKFGHIFVNGYDASPNQRGYNVVLIPSDSILKTFNFDTFANPAASTELAKLINTAPPNTTIALAAADEASASLTEEAVQAIQTTGATGDLRNCFRCSHAVIGIKNSGPAIEGLNPFRPVGITTNLGLTEPNIAALVDWIKIEPVTSP